VAAASISAAWSRFLSEPRQQIGEPRDASLHQLGQDAAQIIGRGELAAPPAPQVARVGFEIARQRRFPRLAVERLADGAQEVAVQR